MKWHKSIIDTITKGRGKQILLFVVFLVISYLFWMLRKLDDTEDFVVDIPIEYVNIPSTLIFTTPPPNTINVAINDKGLNILNYYINKSTKIRINYLDYEIHRGKQHLSQTQLQAAVRAGLKPTTQLIAVHLDSIVLNYASSIGKQTPVRENIAINPAINYIQTGDIEITPQTVEVFADTSILKRVTYVETERITIKDVTDTVKVKVALKKINGVKYFPDSVEIFAPVEEVIKRSYNLPITCKNLPKGVSMVTFPAEAKVNFFIPFSKYNKIDKSKFSLTANYKSITPNQTKIPIVLDKSPKDILQIEIEPDSIEYILEVIK